MNDLLTQSNIIKNKQKYVPKKGVYFLIFKNKIVYVGSSTNVDSRINSHFRAKQIPFDSITFIETDNYLQLELKYIVKFNPPYNKSFLKLNCETALSLNIVKLSLVKQAVDNVQNYFPEYKKINGSNFIRFLNKYPVKPFIGSKMFNCNKIFDAVKKFYKFKNAKDAYDEFICEITDICSQEINPNYNNNEDDDKEEK